MFSSLRVIALLSCLSCLAASGCVTDKVVVFKKHVITNEDMKKHHGDYAAKQWPGDMKPDRVRVYEKNGKQRFTYRVDESYDVQFIASTVPGSKKKVTVIAMPSQEATEKDVLFLLARSEKETLQFWFVSKSRAVAKGRLKVKQDVFLAEDVKTFLKAHADAFVEANKPDIVLQKMKN